MPDIVKANSPREVIEGRSMLVKKLRVLPVEAIVRGYITGSAWKVSSIKQFNVYWVLGFGGILIAPIITVSHPSLFSLFSLLF